jgi:hypothetical protein
VSEREREREREREAGLSQLMLLLWKLPSFVELLFLL